MDRTLAALGLLKGVETEFVSSYDVANSGILLSLPFLESNYLLKDLDKYFAKLAGYYRLDHIFIVLGFMALSRIKTPEQLIKISPGEWGKCLGLDRIPAIKTMRQKINLISSAPSSYDWSSSVSTSWLNNENNNDGLVGHFYIDGHVRVYYGSQTKLPKHYVSREKLCLRSMIDYWVNDEKGQPFFVLTTALSDGMTKMIREDVVPRILKDVKPRYSESELEADPELHKFVMVYDREAYGYQLMWDMRQIRVACQTYNKFPKLDWPVSVFSAKDVKRVFGNVEKMMIAEKVLEKDVEVIIEGKTTKVKLKVREIRVLTESGHQTAIVSTDYKSSSSEIASYMFARWCQENYFKYMMQDFGIDRLIDYSVQEIDGSSFVISPAYRTLESTGKKQAGKLGSLQKKFGTLAIEEEKLAEDDKKSLNIISYKKAQVLVEIELAQNQLAETKKAKKETLKYIKIDDLKENEKFKQLASPGKHFIDTIKMIAYRAETAMAILIKEWLPDYATNARSILKIFYQADADIIPNKETSVLNIMIHTQTTPTLNKILKNLCEHLNQTNFIFPGTNLKMNYQLIE